MSYFIGTIAHGSNGVKTVSVGFQPKGMRITVAQKYATAQNFAHKSVGITDGVDQYCDSIYQDTSGGITVSSDTKLISHYDRVGGVITEVLAGTINSFTATQVKYNITAHNANYNLLLEVWS